MVIRKTRHMAVNPEGESAKARSQPPNVPNKKKNGNIGGRATPASRIRPTNSTYTAGHTSSALANKMSRHMSIR